MSSLFCSHCGKENAPTVTICSQCQSPIGHTQHPGAPPVESTSPNWLSPMVMAIICVLYLINPTMGVFELIPDNLPIVGNLDEAAATTGLWIALSRLGLNPFTKR